MKHIKNFFWALFTYYWYIGAFLILTWLWSINELITGEMYILQFSVYSMIGYIIGKTTFITASLLLIFIGSKNGQYVLRLMQVTHNNRPHYRLYESFEIAQLIGLAILLIGIFGTIGIMIVGSVLLIRNYCYLKYICRYIM